MCKGDFTFTNSMGATIARLLYDHLIYHFDLGR